jgi:hypothetical protein
MPTFDHQIFFKDFPSRTGLELAPERRKALDFLLSKFEEDEGFTMIRELAYVLATIGWETAWTFRPIKERRINREKFPKLWERQNVYWETGFYGRGYVQLTHDYNYARAGKELEGKKFSIDGSNVIVDPDAFVDNPDYALNPEASYAICSSGMRKGWFTGKKLGNYIKDEKPPDYVNARRVINGIDRAEEIADIAGKYELLLRAASS